MANIKQLEYAGLFAWMHDYDLGHSSLSLFMHNLLESSLIEQQPRH